MNKEFLDYLGLSLYDTKIKEKINSVKQELTTEINNKVSTSDMEVIIVDANGHEYVDLGLPSGTLWATMNVGASSETDYGNYYKYGLGASQYDNAQTNYSGVENPLAATADTATIEWGGQWHMPTKAQLEELTARTTYQWVTDYQGSGVNGGTFTANGQTLFIPAAGYYDYGSLDGVGEGGYIWSSTPLGGGFAHGLYFRDGGNGVSINGSRLGESVRPVLNASKGPKYATKAELNAKQDIIDSSHKLNADLIENGTTNKVINVKPDWNAASGSDAEILNKPTIPSLSGYATETYVSLQIGTKQPILTNGLTYSSPTGTVNISSDSLLKFTNVGTLNINCSNIYNSSHRAVLLLQTGSNPDISFVYNKSNDNNNDFYGTTGIMYAGSSGVFLANSKYIIYIVGSNVGCVITQFKLSDTPVAGENGVEETTSGGPGWRVIEGSSNNGEILVNSAGKVVTIELSEKAFYRYLNDGNYLAVCDSLSYAIPPGEQLVVSGFGTQTYSCTPVNINSSTEYTLTIDGAKYVITYNALNHTITTSPELGNWTASPQAGLYWRTSLDSQFQKVLVDYTGKVFADGPSDSGNTTFFVINSGGNFSLTGGTNTPQSSISAYGSSEYSGQWNGTHSLFVVTVNDIEYTLTYDGSNTSNSGVSPEITDWTE